MNAIQAYVDTARESFYEAALWAEPCNGQVPTCRDCPGQDCDRSLHAAGVGLDQVAAQTHAEWDAKLDAWFREVYEVASVYDADQVGYDLWMTQAGRGVGFWDGTEDYAKSRHEGIPDANDGQYLDRMVHERFGRDHDVYVGDDGLVYIV